MNWDQIFKQRKPTSLAKVKKIYRSLKIKPHAKIISVVGTNGKGSLASYLAQGLIKNNYRVGVFSSPHLFKPNERIQINNQVISDEKVVELFQKIPTDIHFFATMFLIAMLYFSENNVDVIILEAGIGGKEDTTNAVKADYGVVTSVALDHMDLLGHSLEAIAKQKAGIINRQMTFFIPTRLKENIQEIFINKIKHTKNASFRMINNLSHSYQDRNKMLAKEILKLAFKISFNDFKSLPGRTTVFKYERKNIIYDVGHNKAAFEAVIQQLAKNGIDFKTVVICLARTKEKENIAELFKNKKVYGYQLNENFWSPQELNIMPIDDLDTFKAKNSTLFIGSFHFIEKLWHEKKFITFEKTNLE